MVTPGMGERIEDTEVKFGPGRVGVFNLVGKIKLAFLS